MTNRYQQIASALYVKYLHVLPLGERILLKSFQLVDGYMYMLLYSFWYFLSLLGHFWNVNHRLGNISVCYYREYGCLHRCLEDLDYKYMCKYRFMYFRHYKEHLNYVFTWLFRNPAHYLGNIWACHYMDFSCSRHCGEDLENASLSGQPMYMPI